MSVYALNIEKCDDRFPKIIWNEARKIVGHDFVYILLRMYIFINKKMNEIVWVKRRLKKKVTVKIYKQMGNEWDLVREKKSLLNVKILEI